MDAWDEGAWDAWPEPGIGIWPSRPGSEPLLPPLPEFQPEGTSLGWVLEWPVAWLGDAAFEVWGHWPTRPRSHQSRRRSLRPRVRRAYHYARDGARYAAMGGRRGGGVVVLMATLLLVSALGLLTLGRSFPAVAQQLDNLRAGATSVGDGISGGIGSTGTGDTPTNPTTPGPVAILPPALGSDAQAFAAFFGAGAPAAGATDHYHVQLKGVSIALDVTFGVGTDRHDHVTRLSAGAASFAGWDVNTADAVCGAFLPPDAALQDVTHSADDTEYRYTSTSLTATFPRAYFVDDAYTPVAPGTLIRLDHPPLGSATGVGSCTFSLGAH